MGKYNIGEVWWTQFPFEDSDEDKHRPAIVIDDNTIAVLAMMVTSKEKNNPFCVKIDDWKDAGFKIESWARIDRIINMDEWRMDRKIGNLSEGDLKKFMELIVEFMTGTIHELFDIYNLHIMTKSYFGEIESARQCVGKFGICFLMHT